MKRKLDTRVLGLVVGLCILLYAAGGYFFVLSPKKGEANRLDDQIASATVELMNARAANDKRGDTQPIAVADIFRLATAMPSAQDMPGILLELARIAEETGIRFKAITPQSPAPSGDYTVVPIDVTFDGTFYSLSDFLFRLRTLVSVRRGELHAAGRLFSVESVDFSEGDGGFPSLAAALKLHAYVYGTDLAGAALPAPTAPATAPPADGGVEVPPPTAEATAAGATG